MPYHSKSLGIVIGRLRVERGLTQEVLSGLADISRSHLADLENGRKIARLDTLWRIAEALGLPPSRLIALAEAEAAGKPPPGEGEA